MIAGMAPDRRPLELILARNLTSAISTPAFVVDEDGTMSFFNEAAAEIIGRRFEESSRLTAAQWQAIGPVDESGEPLAIEGFDPATDLRAGRPVIASLRIATDRDGIVEVTASGVPLVSGNAFRGALVTFVQTGHGLDEGDGPPPAEDGPAGDDAEARRHSHGGAKAPPSTDLQEDSGDPDDLLPGGSL